MSKTNSKFLILIVLLFIVIFGFYQVRTNLELFSKIRSSLPFHNISTEVIYDFREQEPHSIFEKVSESETKEIFSKLFKKHLEKEEDCPSKPTQNADFLETGLFVPEMKGKLAGSFTEKNKSEILYLISINDCAQAKETWYPELVVIFSGEMKTFQTLITPIDEKDPVGYFAQPLKLLDLNQDQINEILVMGSGAGQGINVESAQILKIQNNHLIKITDFREVYEDSCDAGYENSAILASLITYQGEKGTKPDFEIQNYTKSCIANSSFQATDKKIGE